MLWRVLRSHADEDRIFLVDLFDGGQSLAAHINGDAAGLIFAPSPNGLPGTSNSIPAPSWPPS